MLRLETGLEHCPLTAPPTREHDDEPTIAQPFDYAEERNPPSEARPGCKQRPFGCAADVLRATAPHTTETPTSTRVRMASRCNARRRIDESSRRSPRPSCGSQRSRAKLRRLDFHEVGVGQIKLALRAAYEAGRQMRCNS